MNERERRRKMIPCAADILGHEKLNDHPCTNLAASLPLRPPSALLVASSGVGSDQRKGLCIWAAISIKVTGRPTGVLRIHTIHHRGAQFTPNQIPEPASASARRRSTGSSRTQAGQEARRTQVDGMTGGDDGVLAAE